MSVRILGIESSCDETSAAVVIDGRIIESNVIASQVDLHRQYGGVVPEIASRKHVELVLPVVQEALERASASLNDIDAVAVTAGPGLVGALLVGLSAAKALAWARELPLVAVNHLRGHIYANFLAKPNLDFPLLCLIVSGGHTDLVYLEGHDRLRLLGQTRDDAAGEAFDKVARVLGLSYPGGPQVDRLAQGGDPEAIAFPRSYLEEGSLDFSFSGLKTAVIHYQQGPGPHRPLADVAASFQAAVAEVLVDKTMQAARQLAVRQVLLAGGVAANSALRRAMDREAARRGLEVTYPSLELCTDNAAMIAAAGYFLYQGGHRAGWDLNAQANLPLA
ncbi:MAG: tRNA (adenosine(37)-N6)-threonylcarbamoyltransferase complex transferase subunit TsaD [Firmicutes bacterium]|nr:tRNA (adenosine(37)-N6)-threonylcarbamoyltransferase complex transferase subunit TsaD [Bacillota bacterium]